jgi:2-methylaconitate cis-trans-isomerase PrpF
VGPPTHPDADVDYTFAAIGVKNLDVDYSSNCGNMTSAIGPFAVDNGLVEGEEGNVTVRIHNTNTGKLLPVGRLRLMVSPERLLESNLRS